jgi:RimJ/RimL family protein N-acetyltransferase
MPSLLRARILRRSDDGGDAASLKAGGSPAMAVEEHRLYKADMQATERLSFRPIHDRDFETLRGFWSDPDVREHLVTRPATRKAFRRLFKRMQASETMWIACLRESGSVVGRCGFYEFGSERTPELAYLLGRPWWGKGLATEMGASALRYAFEQHHWPQVIALVRPDNTRSLAVVRKLGFVHQDDIKIRNLKVQRHCVMRG